MNQKVARIRLDKQQSGILPLSAYPATLVSWVEFKDLK